MSLKRGPSYLSVVVVTIVLLHIVGFIKAERSPVAISSHASIPNYALQNARLYMTDKLYSRSLLHLKEAIRSISYLRDHADDASRKHLTTGLDALRSVERDMYAGYFYSNKLNENSVIALNALMYYEIASARQFIEEEKRPQAMKALALAIEHLRNALDFAKGNMKDYEVKVFTDIKDITSNYYLEKSEFISKLDNILEELEDLDVAYSQ